MTNTTNILAAGGQGNPWSSFIMMGLLFVIMWVVIIRPQQKRQKELAARQASLKVGDKVVTIGGMHATINAVGDKTVSLRLADNVFVKYDKSAIATVLNKTSEEKDAN